MPKDCLRKRSRSPDAQEGWRSRSRAEDTRRPDAPSPPHAADIPGDFGDYFAQKKAKLMVQQRPVHPDKPSIFTGITLHINGYTEPSFQILRDWVCERGGQYQYHPNLSSMTHLVATTLTPAKWEQFK